MVFLVSNNYFFGFLVMILKVNGMLGKILKYVKM